MKLLLTVCFILLIATCGAQKVADGKATVTATPLALNFTIATSENSATNSFAISSVIDDATDIAAKKGIVVEVKDNQVGLAAEQYSIVAFSSNEKVVPVSNIKIIKDKGRAVVKIIPTSAGYSTITLMLSALASTKKLQINYAASAGTSEVTNTFWPTGMSDASAAIAMDDDYMIVGDDEINKLFVYNRNSSARFVKSFDYSQLLNLGDVSGGVPREVDVEAAVRSVTDPTKIYWLGSLSNSATSFNTRSNRNRLFSTEVTGTGLNTEIKFNGSYDKLRENLIMWGDKYGYNFSASAASKHDPKMIDGFNVEGLVFAPDNTTAYIGFRAPLVPTADRTKAVIAPVNNFEKWFSNGAPATDPVIDSPIELDLGGRGIRDIIRLSGKNYLILAGNYDDAPANPAIFFWTGNRLDAPVLQTGYSLAGLNPEAALEVKRNGSSDHHLQLLSDEGAHVFYDDATEAKNLTEDNFKKFRVDVFTNASTSTPPDFEYFIASRQQSKIILAWKMPIDDISGFVVERSSDGIKYKSLATIFVQHSLNAPYYSFEDTSQIRQKFYYRIKAVSIKLSRQFYSSVKTISTSEKQLVKVFPNPDNTGHINVVTSLPGNKKVVVSYINGAVIYSSSYNTPVTEIDTGKWNKGIYQVQVISSKTKSQQLLLVVK